LRVYFYRNCLALCSGKRYRNDTTHLDAHITNTAFQMKANSNFCEEHCILPWKEDDIAPILVQDGTFETILAARNAVGSAIDQMGAITGELFRVYQSEFGVFAPMDGCFEHYGFDFLVDDAWNVFLLEVNPGPDFKQSGNALQTCIETLMGCTIDVALLSQISGRPYESTKELKLVYEQSCPTSHYSRG
jgi:tubulin---tyrosine ligase